MEHVLDSNITIRIPANPFGTGNSNGNKHQQVLVTEQSAQRADIKELMTSHVRSKFGTLVGKFWGANATRSISSSFAGAGDVPILWAW